MSAAPALSAREAFSHAAAAGDAASSIAPSPEAAPRSPLSATTAASGAPSAPAASEGKLPVRARSRASGVNLIPAPSERRGDDESDGDYETAVVPGVSVSRRSKAFCKITLAQSFKSLKSAFSSRSSRTHLDPVQLRIRTAAGNQGLRLTQSLLPVQREYRDPWRTQLVKWINYRVRMEAFFAIYSLWTLQRALALCCIGMVVFLTVGIALLVLNDSHVECKLNYEEYSLGEGGTRYECLPITADICGPGKDIRLLDGEEVYVYYELENFHQNGGQIIWNRSDRQLAGQIFTDPADVSDCEPYATKVVDNVTKVLHPCGALAWNVFNDNFLFFAEPPDGLGEHGAVKPLPLMQRPEEILQPHRWRTLYKNPSASERKAARDKVYFWMSVDDNDDGRLGRGKPEEGLAWAIHESLNFEEAGMMVENSHFIQWMEPAAMPTFRKLYGRLKGPLKLPLYAYISINYDVKPWGGKKAVILSVPSVFYGRTLYMGIAYLVFGSILLLFSLYLLWRLHLSKDESATGDIRWRTMLNRGKRKTK